MAFISDFMSTVQKSRWTVKIIHITLFLKIALTEPLSVITIISSFEKKEKEKCLSEIKCWLKYIIWGRIFSPERIRRRHRCETVESKQQRYGVLFVIVFWWSWEKEPAVCCHACRAWTISPIGSRCSSRENGWKHICPSNVGKYIRPNLSRCTQCCVFRTLFKFNTIGTVFLSAFGGKSL